MSRSCQSATFSSPTVAAARTTLARPQIRSETTGFRHLRHLGAREVADLERELLERRRDDRERRQQLGVAVALQDLRRGGRGLEAQPLTGDAFDLRVGCGIGADRS